MNGKKPLTMAGEDIDNLATAVLSMTNLINRAIKRLDSAQSELLDVDKGALAFVNSEILQAKLLLKEAIGE